MYTPGSFAAVASTWPLRRNGRALKHARDGREDILLAARAVNLDGDALVRGEDGAEVLVELREAHLRLLRRVVGAVRHARHHVAWRRVEGEMVDAAGLGVEPAADDALDQHRVGHVEVEHEVGLDLRGAQRGRLHGCAREAVEQPAVRLAVGLREPLAHEVDDHLVGHELAAIHVLLGGEAHLGTRLHRSTQHVARRQMHEPKLALDQLALRPLA
mmetsp:Transcript_8909/g.27996  ORF Transcript_8909/g.27996 Transcript_8909/m.27996 type:complete len:215 (+) Transcript_8909:911-1555(+)